MRHAAILLLAVVGAASAAGCARSPNAPEAPKRTCAVLSVGEAKGVAHIGALDAMREKGFRPDCVVGNSMGAMIGAMYASAPDDDLTETYFRFADRYEDVTRRNANRRGGGLGLLGALLVIVSGGTALPALVVGGAGYAAGAGSVDKIAHERTVEVLDEVFESRRISELEVPFVTSWLELDDGELRRAHSTDEPVAVAVGHSIANPFLFEDLELDEMPAFDPGTDRVSATPIELACRLFPDARLVAINVTGDEAFWSARMRCPVLVVDVDLGDIDAEEVLRGDREFFRVVDAGRRATASALSAPSFERPR
jgi:NTE family protein